MEKFPNTPAGRQGAWWLDLMASGKSTLPQEEVETRFQPWILQASGESGKPEISVEALVKTQWFRPDPTTWFEKSEMTSFEVSEIDDIASNSVRMVLTGVDGRRWLFSLWTDPEGRLSWIDCYRAHKKGVVIRKATPEDGPALAEVERLCPIEREGGTFTYDRGDDFFASVRLTEDTTIALAEFEGKVVGFAGTAFHRANIGGEERSLILLGQLRSLPEHRGGLSISLSYKTMDPYGGIGANQQNFIAEGNTRMLARRPQGRWETRVHRAILQCSSFAGPPTGRPATKEDAPRIVEVLNECHRDEELYLPYDVDSFTTRMERAPDLYSWENVWLTDRAVLGVWPHAFKAIRELNGALREHVWGLALDHGFLAGADHELESLLRGYCSRLAEAGTDQLSIFTSPKSPNYALLSHLDAELESFIVWIMRTPEPPGAAEHGIYVDQIYF